MKNLWKYMRLRRHPLGAELINPRYFQPALPLPRGYRAGQLRDSLERIRIDGSGEGELAERFNGLFYGPMDYAVLGWKVDG